MLLPNESWINTFKSTEKCKRIIGFFTCPYYFLEFFKMPLVFSPQTVVDQSCRQYSLSLLLHPLLSSFQILLEPQSSFPWGSPYNIRKPDQKTCSFYFFSFSTQCLIFYFPFHWDRHHCDNFTDLGEKKVRF